MKRSVLNRTFKTERLDHAATKFDIGLLRNVLLVEIFSVFLICYAEVVLCIKGLRHLRDTWPVDRKVNVRTVIPRLTKIIRSGITFVSRNVVFSGVSLLAVSNVNNPVGLVGLAYVMWSAHFFVTHIQTEKISSWNGPTVHVCCFMLARASTKTFVSRVRKTAKKNFVSRRIR